MGKIESLTVEQEQLRREWYRRWFAIGCSCEPADRPRAETAIAAMYAEINEAAPRFIWVQSPATACLAIAALRQISTDASLQSSLQASLRASLQSSLQASLRASLRASLQASLGASLGASLQASLWDSLWDSLGASLGASLRASLWDSLGASLQASLWDSLGDSRFWGQQEAHWIAFYAFCRDVVGVSFEKKRAQQLDLWSEIAQSCGWWWPYKGLCIVADRPEIVRWETDRDRPRLHCDSGPALRYRDGWEVYSWHGLRVPEKLIEEPGAISVADIHAEQNQELRRAKLEIAGWERYLREAGARQIASDDTGELLEVDGLGDGDPIARFVHVRCPSTGREYTLRVPPQTETARAGVAWTFNTPADTYQPAQET